MKVYIVHEYKHRRHLFYFLGKYIPKIVALALFCTATTKFTQ